MREVVPVAEPIQVKEYKSSGDFESDARRMAERGWEVVSTAERSQRSGCRRIMLLGGVGALVFKPKPRIVVTYRQAG